MREFKEVREIRSREVSIANCKLARDVKSRVDISAVLGMSRQQLLAESEERFRQWVNQETGG